MTRWPRSSPSGVRDLTIPERASPRAGQNILGGFSIGTRRLAVDRVLGSGRFHVRDDKCHELTVLGAAHVGADEDVGAGEKETVAVSAVVVAAISAAVSLWLPQPVRPTVRAVSPWQASARLMSRPHVVFVRPPPHRQPAGGRAPTYRGSRWTWSVTAKGNPGRYS